MHLFSLIADVDAAAGPAPTLREVLRDGWSFPVLPAIGLLLSALVYLRGWRRAKATRPRELPGWRAACYFGGLAAVWIAIASPIDALDDSLLTAHMLQHFILMSIAPPLIVLGVPVVPVLRGLPRWVVRSVLRPFLANGNMQRLAHGVTNPALIWIAANAIFLGWHVPAAFELTFRSEAIHNLEHLCFFGSSVAFWWVVLLPWPGRQRWPEWSAIPYLLSADVVNTILSALLTFGGRVAYPSYAFAPRVCKLNPLQDQIAAGAEMWVLNSSVFLVAAVVLTIRLLSPNQPRAIGNGAAHKRS